jgi:hypothetical protein
MRTKYIIPTLVFKKNVTKIFKEETMLHGMDPMPLSRDLGLLGAEESEDGSHVDDGSVSHLLQGEGGAVQDTHLSTIGIRFQAGDR